MRNKTIFDNESSGEGVGVEKVLFSLYIVKKRSEQCG